MAVYRWHCSCHRARDGRSAARGGRKRGVRVMAIVVNLDVMLARRKMRSKDLAETIGITEANLSLLKSGKVKGVRFSTLEKICAVLECQPGELLEYRPGE
jgi:putative transcriptional regulator